MPTNCDIFLLAGEVSGDLHGEKIMQGLKELSPNISLYGVGGPRMRKEGLNCVMPMENFQVMGFIDVFLALPKLIKQFYALKKQILKLNPKIVFLIDYPGLNLKLAEHLRKAGYQGKICHYIAPTVWAWKKKRAQTLEKYYNRLFYIFPFEGAYFKNTDSFQSIYVGHPLISRLNETTHIPLALPEKKIISLFPGSRSKEISLNFPLHLDVAKKLLEEDPNLHFVISVSHPRFQKPLEEHLDKKGLPADSFSFVDGNRNYDLMKVSDLAIAKSGTVTLELAIHNVPTVVTYGIKPLDLFLAQKIFKINLPFYCIVNIIANKEIFPELFGPNLTFDNLYRSVKKYLNNPRAREDIQKELSPIIQSLGQFDAHRKTALETLTLFSM